MNIESRVAKLEQVHGTPAGCDKCAKFGNHFDALKEGRTEADIFAEIEADALQEPHVVDALARKMTCQMCGRPLVLVVQTVDNWRG